MLRALRHAATRIRASSITRHAANKDGTAATEFALLLPLLITLFFGVVESSLAFICRSDVSLMASTAGDLISQANATNTADISNVYSAAGTVLYPYYDPAAAGSAKPTIRITSVIDDGSGATGKNHMTGKVAWTCTQAGSGTLTPSSRAKDETVSLPQPLMTENGSIVIAEIAYSYSSATTKVIGGPINFTNNFYAKPRRVLQIAAPTGGCP
ncbi:MAG TPA: TadE/TadG family type IV pilus assembly protein [Rhizomicrobium sp.]|nr:TadE/TadG family type IV pilus assembly protein [Rhizomicrobium sp.]